MIQNNCMLIGLTGGISTGKSTVSKIIAEKGFPIIDADQIARKVVEIGKPAYRKIIAEFGEDIVLEDQTIDRKALGRIIFNNKEAREKLNSITHPYIFEDIRFRVEELSKEEAILFLDIPLLFEQYDLWEKYHIKFDEIWLVYLNQDIQIKRLMKRDHISEEEAIVKIKSQMDINYKKERSSKTIDNSGNIDDLREQVNKLLEELI